MIHDRIVFGVASPKSRDKLTNDGDKLTLDRAIHICQSFEYAQEQLKSLSIASTPKAHVAPKVHAVRNARRQPTPKPRRDNKTAASQKTPENTLCGIWSNRAHVNNAMCPARGVTCRRCSKKNHFQKICRSQTVDTVNVSYEELYIDSEKKDNVEKNSMQNGQYFVELKVGSNSTPINFKLDTGSQVNILPFRL